MRKQQIATAGLAALMALFLSLGCSLSGDRLPSTDSQSAAALTATRTRYPHEVIDFNATVLAATVRASGGFVVTSTPLPVWPTATSTPFDQVSFLATINAQFAQATETARALATPTFTPSPTLLSTPTPPPPRFLPPAGGQAPGGP